MFHLFSHPLPLPPACLPPGHSLAAGLTGVLSSLLEGRVARLLALLLLFFLLLPSCPPSLLTPVLGGLSLMMGRGREGRGAWGCALPLPLSLALPCGRLWTLLVLLGSGVSPVLL